MAGRPDSEPGHEQYILAPDADREEVERMIVDAKGDVQRLRDIYYKRYRCTPNILSGNQIAKTTDSIRAQFLRIV